MLFTEVKTAQPNRNGEFKWRKLNPQDHGFPTNHGRIQRFQQIHSLYGRARCSQSWFSKGKNTDELKNSSNFTV